MPTLSDQARGVLEKAASTITVLQAANGDLEAKVASYDRLRLAEDIAVMQASADGETSYADVLAERDKLASSKEDLGQMKLAMQTYGPGRIQIRTVAEGSVAADAKTAGTLPVGTEPAHIAQAREQLNAVQQALG